jgi:hypothetical protein
MPPLYIIVFSHEDYDGSHIIPSADIAPRRVYGSIDAAEKAINELIEKLDSFSPALYGEVYPFENTTAKEEIAKKGKAIYGWAKDVTDEGDVIRYGVYIDSLHFD